MIEVVRCSISLYELKASFFVQSSNECLTRVFESPEVENSNTNFLQFWAKELLQLVVLRIVVNISQEYVHGDLVVRLPS